MTLKFSGTFQDLAAKLEELNGQWDESQPNKKVLRLNDGVMNWFETNVIKLSNLPRNII